MRVKSDDGQKIRTEILSRLSVFNSQSGIPHSYWLELESFIQSSPFSLGFEAELKAAIPEISEMALEAGFYSLALSLGLTSQFDIGSVYLYLGKQTEFNLFLESLVPSSLERIALEMFALRRSGKAKQAVNLYQNLSSAGLVETSDEIVGSLLLQAGHSFFACSEYGKSLECYQRAYLEFEKKQKIGKMAIASFNSAVAAEQIQGSQKLFGGHSRATSSRIVNVELWRAQGILSRYHLENLQISVHLFEIERAVAAEDYRECLVLCESFKLFETLSIGQSILFLQARSRSYLELGHVVQAEADCVQARRLMIQSKHFQFEGFQLALELNLETMIHRKIVRSRSISSIQVTSDNRAKEQMLYAQVRKSILLGKSRASLKVMLSSGRELPEDLMVSLEKKEADKLRTPRGLEALVFQTIFEKREQTKSAILSTLQKKQDSSVIEKVLIIFLGAVKSSKIVVESEVHTLYQLAELEGLERWETVALGLLFYLNSEKYHNIWMDRMDRIEKREQAWFREFFLNLVGVDLFETKTVMSSNGKILISDSKKITADLVIDDCRGKIIAHGVEVGLDHQSILFHILKHIAQNQERGASKEDLVKNVWGLNYHPLQHDPMVYTSIRRLREFVKIDMIHNRYCLNPEVNWIYITSSQNQMDLGLSERQRKIISFLKTQPKITRAQVVQALSVSERTALRELTALVEIGVLQREGLGRGAGYKNGVKS